MATRNVWKRRGILGGCVLSLLVLGSTDAEARKTKKNRRTAAVVAHPVNPMNMVQRNAVQATTVGMGLCRKTVAMLQHQPTGTADDFKFVPVIAQLREPQEAMNPQFLQAVEKNLTSEAQVIFRSITTLLNNADQYNKTMLQTLLGAAVDLLAQTPLGEGGAYDHDRVPVENWKAFGEWCRFMADDGLKGLKKELKTILSYVGQNLFVKKVNNNGQQQEEVNEETEFLLAFFLQQVDSLLFMHEYAAVKDKVVPAIQTLSSSSVNWTLGEPEVKLAMMLSNYFGGRMNAYLLHRQVRDLLDADHFSSPLSDWLSMGAQLVMAMFSEGQELGKLLFQTLLATMTPALKALESRGAMGQTVLPNLQTSQASIPSANLSGTLDLSKLLQGQQNPSIQQGQQVQQGILNLGSALDLSKSQQGQQVQQSILNLGSAQLPGAQNAQNMIVTSTGQVIPLGGMVPNLQAIPPSQKNQPQQKEEKNGISVNDINSILKTLNSFRQPAAKTN